MPSASAKLEKQSSMEMLDPIKQIVSVVEKRVRNLEKRKTKLDSYKNDSQNGKELNEDQKKAVDKYDQVVEILEFAKELQKSFNSVIQESSKAQKKVAKREYAERYHHELYRIKDLIGIQDLLNTLGGEEIRNDFLNGSKGAAVLTVQELQNLDELYKIIAPERNLENPNFVEFDEQLLVAAEHVQSLLDGKNKEVIGTTYKLLKETITKINNCAYFKQSKRPTDTDSKLDSSGDIFGQLRFTNASSNENIHCGNFGKQVSPQRSKMDSGSVEQQLYQGDSSEKFQDEKSQSIQEVLPIQGNLNFLQESQIDMETPSKQLISVTSSNVGYPSSYISGIHTSALQPMTSSHFHSKSKEVILAPQISATQILPNPVSLAAAVQQQQQQTLTFAVSTLQMPSNTMSDFDPNRPIQTQTYTNQRFSNNIHPMMATGGVAVPQSYTPVTHALQNEHIHPGGSINQTVHQRPTRVLDSNVISGHSQPPGLSATSAMSNLSLNIINAKEEFASEFQVGKLQGVQ